jgi:hypothetical protein
MTINDNAHEHEQQPPEPLKTGRRGTQSATALQPLQRPPDDAPAEVLAAYRKERRRRRIVKAARRARIARRESPHDPIACAVCRKVVRHDIGKLRPPEIAARAVVSETTVWRYFSENPKTARGRKTLATARRIAHDGMGITLDELAAIVLD